MGGVRGYEDGGDIGWGWGRLWAGRGGEVSSGEGELECGCFDFGFVECVGTTFILVIRVTI